MLQNDLEELANRVEAATDTDSDLAANAASALRASFSSTSSASQIPDDIATSSDAIVALVNAALPGWHFSIHGRARTDKDAWRCTLRRSDVRDDDEMIGVGEAHSLNRAILAALLRVAARQ
jgi:ribonucleotide monophosphatase NagD (HAD superfamily)